MYGPGIESIKYSDLLVSKEINDFFDIVRNLLNIQMGFAPVDLMTIGPTIHPRDNDNPLCRLIQSTPGGLASCMKSDREHYNKAVESKKAMCYACHAGLTDFVVPVAIGSKNIGVLIGGQVLHEPPSESGFVKLLKNLKDIPIDKEQVRDAYFKSAYLAEVQIESILKLFTIFVELIREKGIRLIPQNWHKVPGFLKAGLDYIGSHFMEPDISLETVAEYTEVAPSYLSWSFKKHLGILFNHYLLDLRLQEAEKLLMDTKIKVVDIAFQCGFGSLSHFNRAFKNNFYCSPQEYRKCIHKAEKLPV